MEAQRVQSESETRSTTTLRGIELLVRRMSTLAGQRSIVIVSDGFLAENQAGAVSRLSDRALRAGIIINAMDSRGLYVYPQNGSPEKERLLIAEAHQASEAMGTLTQNTGGIFFENNNDLEAGFRRLTALPDAAYMLAFSPENLKHDGTFHPLKVTLIAGKGLTVQARKGYFAPAKAQDAAVQEKEDLQDAVFAQNETQTFPIQVNARYFMIDKTNAKIDVVTHVDLQQARFRKEADRNLDNLTFVTVVFDRDGHYVTGQQKVLELRLRDESLGKVRSAGVTVEMELNVKAGTYLVRTVVRDSESGQISARNSTVEIPY